MTDPLPARTGFVSATPSQGACSGTTTVTCELGTLADGASATITLVVHVDPATPGGTVITNTATESSPEPEPEVSRAADGRPGAGRQLGVGVRHGAGGTEGAGDRSQRFCRDRRRTSTGSTTSATGAFVVVAVPRFTG